LVFLKKNFSKALLIKNFFFKKYFNLEENRFLKKKFKKLPKLKKNKISKINKRFYKSCWRLVWLKKKKNQIIKGNFTLEDKKIGNTSLEQSKLSESFFNVRLFKALKKKNKFPFGYLKNFFLSQKLKIISRSILDSIKKFDNEPNLVNETINFYKNKFKSNKIENLSLKNSIKQNLQKIKNIDEDGEEKTFVYSSLVKNKIKLSKKNFFLKRAKKKKFLKTKLKKIILYYFFSKYFEKFYIKFHNVLRLNRFIPKLIKRYYKHFWYFKKNKNFFNLVSSLLFSKIFFSSYFLGFAIAKIFRARKNHGFILKTVARMWQFFQFSLGLKINIKGKWWGSLRTKEKFILSERSVRQSESVMVDYFYYPVTTKYGVFSIKVWLSELTWE